MLAFSRRAFVEASTSKGEDMPRTTIAELDFPSPHEVVGYGRVAPPVRGSERKVEILLRQSRKGREELRYADEAPIARWVGCGHLDDVRIGSLWQTGAMVGHQEKRRTVESSLTFKGLDRLDPSLPPRSPNGAMRIGDMPCFRLVLTDHDGPLKFVWIPVIEVARALFGVSSRFLMQAFAGFGSDRQSRDSSIFDRHMSHRIDADTFHLTCPTGVDDLEAVIAGLALTNGPVLAAYDSLHRSLPLPADGAAHLPKMVFPFPAGTTPWALEGLFLRLHGQVRSVHPPSSVDPTVKEVEPVSKPENRFLVTRIVRLGFKPDFERLEVAVRIPTIGLRRHAAEAPHPVQARLPVALQTVVPPGPRSPTLEDGTGGAMLHPAHHVEIVRLERDQGGRATFVLNGGGEHPRSGSTDAKTADGSGRIVHVRIRREEVSLLNGVNARMKSITATYDAVTSMAGDRGWTILRGGRGQDGTPRLEVASSSKRSFNMLLMVVATSCDYFVIADAGTVPMDKRSLGLIMRADRGSIDEASMRAIRHFAADNEARWRDKIFPDYVVGSVSRHPATVLDDATAYRDLLEGNIERLLASGATSSP